VGPIELSKLSPDDVDAMDARLYADGRALSTRRSARAVPARVLRHAIRKGRLVRNVIERAETLPTAERDEREVLEPHELRALLIAARGTEWEAPVAALVFCGLRRGEVLGLTWPALDMEAGALRVARNLVPLSTGGIALGPPKTRRSRRTLTELDPSLVAVLASRRTRWAEAKLAAGELWVEHTRDHEGRGQHLVFTDELGRPIGPDRLTYAVKRLAQRAGIERAAERVTGPHSLRHAWVSHRLAAGDPVPAVSADAGHSSPQITMSRYAHVIAPGRPAATRVIAEAVGAW
jgi:integrase